MTNNNCINELKGLKFFILQNISKCTTHRTGYWLVYYKNWIYNWWMHAKMTCVSFSKYTTMTCGDFLHLVSIIIWTKNAMCQTIICTC